MNSAGKKLQDIFDAGSTKLGDLKRSQRAALKSAAETHLAEGTSSEHSSSEQIHQQSNEFESSLKESLNRSIARIQKAIDTETQETDKHLKIMMERVSALSQKLQESIAELKELNQSRFTVLSEDACDLYEREFEASATELQKSDYETSQNLKIQDRFVMNSFQQKLDHSLVETRGEEKQISSKLFKAFLQNTTSIDTHSSQLSQQLSQEYQTHAETLSSTSKEGKARLQTHIEELAANSEKQALDLEQKTHELFERVNFDVDAKSNESATSIIQEFKTVHESSDSELCKLTENLRKDLRSTADSARESVRRRSQEAGLQVDQTLESFTAEANKRLDSSLGLRTELETKGGKIVQRIKQDLVELQNSFQQKLSNAEMKALQQLSSISKEAEEAIVSAEKSSVSQLQSLSNTVTTQVETALTDFLSRLQEKRHAAVDEVMKAAGNTADSENSESQAPGRRRKSKTKSADED